jgi:hypothetical protein
MTYLESMRVRSLATRYLSFILILLSFIYTQYKNRVLSRN